MPKRPKDSSPRKGAGLSGLWQAFDDARFGPLRTLNLRESRPTADEAARRLETWLRQQQMERGEEEVLVITGRGNSSHDGVSVVREAAIRLFHSLKRSGVVTGHQEHTPGSFVVELAPVKALWEAPKRRRERPGERPAPAAPASLEALDQETRDLLRMLAERSLEGLGMRVSDPDAHDAFVRREMLRQFGALAASVSEGPDREGRLRAAVRRALDEAE